MPDQATSGAHMVDGEVVDSTVDDPAVDESPTVEPVEPVAAGPGEDDRPVVEAPLSGSTVDGPDGAADGDVDAERQQEADQEEAAAGGQEEADAERQEEAVEAQANLVGVAGEEAEPATPDDPRPYDSTLDGTVYGTGSPETDAADEDAALQETAADRVADAQEADTEETAAEETDAEAVDSDDAVDAEVVDSDEAVDSDEVATEEVTPPGAGTEAVAPEGVSPEDYTPPDGVTPDGVAPTDTVLPVAAALPDTDTAETPETDTADDEAPTAGAAAAMAEPDDGGPRDVALDDSGADGGADGGAPTELSPGDVEFTPLAGLWPTEAAGALRERWRELQLSFVDNPRGAAAEADDLVGEAVDTLTAALASQRAELGAWRTEADAADTEHLRVAVTRYREFLGHVLGV